MIKEDLHIALVQMDVYWHDPVANRAHVEEILSSLAAKTDLIILPEMFTTGFTMTPEKVAEPMELHTTKWMRQMASRLQSVITGSVVINDQGNYYNRLIWVYPDGALGYYDKRHLFRMAKEEEHYAAGQELKTFAVKGWNILPQVCYDLRFPVWSRNVLQERKLLYDFAFYVASWPAKRVQAWDKLLPARAIENHAYVAGVNRIGVDGLEVDYNGHSAVYDCKGDRLTALSEVAGIIEVTLSAKALNHYREKFPAWMDGDSFRLET
ncbi:amidohydrolase [Penaeicola halotolerans]|uniref:amidohydrolase n=1 Tax=Penaeicola halotolerans TaxID=2793196 RepID=UPI001CF854A9|nr:amidohydrolase [Penaeicola halotolerans]